ncbi:flagellar hook protein FlgE [Sulfurospirillum arcachonense]|uniref:flagellar hook protein FlgE n=1 Tax=Sulfurospirillum arcachonense TaxID=57666 RepID=UPI0004680348|nr:flagellar hook protein FlgE [Sulfurospirillum arcachonense]
MMRSLWAGVSGLQAHQLAMDVEGNNIANVNTAGFKYSRVNFSDMLSQTSKIATAPQGELGGKNAMQIGLGTQANSITRIFKQGSTESTDKNTDLALQGDGFFVVSPDGGNTYKYTRNGDFSFDANGNFTDNSGYIVQGWVRDPDTGIIDATAPIGNITVLPGLTTPAFATEYITLGGNLNSGDTIDVTNSIPMYSLDSNSGWVDTDGDGIMNNTEMHNENDLSDYEFDQNKEIIERGQDMGSLFDDSGNALRLQDDEGIWVSYTDAVTESQTITAAAGVNDIDIVVNGINITGSITTSSAIASENDNALATYIQDLIDAESTKTGVTAKVNNNNELVLSNTNNNGTEASAKNINLIVNTGAGVGLTTTEVITAFKYTYTSSSASSNPTVRTSARSFHTTEDLRDAIQTDARLYTDYLGNGMDNTAEVELNKNDGVKVIVNAAGKFEISNEAGDAFNAQDGDIVDSTVLHTLAEVTAVTAAPAGALTNDVYFPVGTAWGTGATTPVAPANTITLPASPAGDVTLPEGTVYNIGGGSLTAPVGGVVIAGGNTFSSLVLPNTAGLILPTGTTFTNTAELVLAGTNVKSTNDHNLNLKSTAYTDEANKIGENEGLKNVMGQFSGTIPSGIGTKASGGLKAAHNGSSIDIFDSLGSKHTVKVEFTKIGYTTDGGTEWSMLISVPEPGDINLGVYPKNIVTGTMSFNSDGSLASYSPSNISFTANNGSTPNQSVSFNFGTLGKSDGMNSTSGPSKVKNLSQDGYPGGDLAGIRVDETGTLIGTFSNGRSFGLAQVSTAKFANNGGLESDGGNAFVQTSNSGDPLIGQAGIGGRGSIQASSLEMSNVDLSRSLTQLIIIQRGYQANSKTITTSDQLLNTLLQLKQ